MYNSPLNMVLFISIVGIIIMEPSTKYIMSSTHCDAYRERGSHKHVSPSAPFHLQKYAQMPTTDVSGLELTAAAWDIPHSIHSEIKMSGHGGCGNIFLLSQRSELPDLPSRRR